jgi:hypothetical protein
MTRASNGRHPFWLLVMGLGVCRTAAEQSRDSTLPPSAPPFKQLRYDENYAYLRIHRAIPNISTQSNSFRSTRPEIDI